MDPNWSPVRVRERTRDQRTHMDTVGCLCEVAWDMHKMHARPLTMLARSTPGSRKAAIFSFKQYERFRERMEIKDVLKS